VSGQRWRRPWEPLPDGTITDDHGQPAVWDVCNFCGRRGLVMYSYTEASGPCRLWLYAEDSDGEPMELGDPRLDGGGFMCSNCECVIHLCVDREACAREAVTSRDDGGCAE
jgi:hypothetical protein